MKIVCKQSDGYNITVGKEYEAIELEAKRREVSATSFTWPAYVQFKDDNGKICIAHASRFVTLEGEKLDEFINKN